MSEWSQLSGTPDLDKFDENQRRELLEGIAEDLPYQMYADPKLSAFEMKEFRVLLSRSALVRGGPNAVLKEGMGPCFKSYLNYKTNPDEVCYIPENYDPEWDPYSGKIKEGYTANDILKLCNGDQDLADMVFSLCDWQHPSTVLDEMDEDDDRALLEIKKEKLKVLQEEIAEIEKSLEPDLPPTILYLDAETPAADAKVDGITLYFHDRTTAKLEWERYESMFETKHNLFHGKFINLTLNGEPIAGHIGKLDGAWIQSVSVSSKSSPGVPFQVTELEFHDGNQSQYFDVEGYALVQTSGEDRFRKDLRACQSSDRLENKIQNADRRCQNQFTTRAEAWKEGVAHETR